MVLKNKKDLKNSIYITPVCAQLAAYTETRRLTAHPTLITLNGQEVTTKDTNL